jgi:hypothetical protein
MPIPERAADEKDTKINVRDELRALFDSTVQQLDAGNGELVRMEIRKRFLALMPTVQFVLQMCLERADWPHALRAAQMICDRAGFPAKVDLVLPGEGLPEEDYTKLTAEELRARALTLANRLAGEKPPSVPVQQPKGVM